MQKLQNSFGLERVKVMYISYRYISIQSSVVS